MLFVGWGNEQLCWEPVSRTYKRGIQRRWRTLTVHQAGCRSRAQSHAGRGGRQGRWRPMLRGVGRGVVLDLDCWWTQIEHRSIPRHVKAPMAHVGDEDDAGRDRRK